MRIISHPRLDISPLSFLILSDPIWDTVESRQAFPKPFPDQCQKEDVLPVCHAFPAQSVPLFRQRNDFLFDPRKSAMDVTAKIAATPAATAITIFSIWRSFKRLLTQFFEPSIFLNKIWNEMVKKGTCKTHVFC